MKARTILIITILGILAGSCIPSLYPLYRPEDVVFDDRVVGTWDGGDIGVWTIEKLEYHSDASPMNPSWAEPDLDSDFRNIRYRLTVKEVSEGDTAKAEFLMHLLVLDGRMYANFYPQEFELQHEFLRWHMVEVNNFARISISNDQFSLQYFDPDYVRDLIERNRIRISHVWLNNMLLLTAPTEELQKFVIKYANEEDALVTPDVFNRI